MSENLSTGLLFKDALLDYSEKYKDDNDICGVKIDMRPQGIDLIVGIRFVENESQFTVCTGGTNCEGADDSHFDLLSEALTNIGVASQSGAAIMIKRNAQVVSTEDGCSAIETVEEVAMTSVEAPKKRGGLFGLFGK